MNKIEKKVGVAGFEPAASSSQTRRDNRATLHPEIDCKSNQIIQITKLNTERGGFEPPIPLPV